MCGNSPIEPEAFERLYRELAPRLVNYLRANACAGALAADIVQEAFLRLWKRREELDDDPVRLSGLAYAMVRNLRTDNWRRTQRETVVEELPEVTAPAAEVPGDARFVALADEIRKDILEDGGRLNEKFKTFNEKLREPLRLSLLKMLTLRDFSARMDSPERTTASGASALGLHLQGKRARSESTHVHCRAAEAGRGRARRSPEDEQSSMDRQ